MVEVFKTDVAKKRVAQALVKSLSMQFPDYKINIDFSDCDKVLRVESESVFDADQILNFTRRQNVRIEVLA